MVGQIAASHASAKRMATGYCRPKATAGTHFYRYLQGMTNQAQFIVIENHKSDQDVVTPYANYQFTKNPSIGRAGLFV